MTTTKRPDGGELKPCPFCGSEAVISVSRDGDVCNVRCSKWEPGYCLGAGPNTYSEPTAIAAWNTRTPSNESHAPQADETANDIADALERSTQSMARECKVGMGLWNGHSNACLNAIALLRKAAAPAPQAGEGIYIASKTVHASRWRILRDKVGEPIISTWIDEAGAGESKDLHDLWHRCLTEAAACRVLIAYREKDEVLKGGWVEIGAALSSGVPVYAVGLEEFTIAKYRGITHFPDMKSAIAESRKLLRSPVPAPQPPVEGLREALELSMDALNEATAILGGEYGDYYKPLCDMMLELKERSARLLASPSLTAGAWQDISTAPKDGTHVLVCDQSDPSFTFSQRPPTVAHWFGPPDLPGLRSGGWYLSVSYNEQPRLQGLTHWQPLPVAPATLIEQSGQE